MKSFLRMRKSVFRETAQPGADGGLEQAAGTSLPGSRQPAKAWHSRAGPDWHKWSWLAAHSCARQTKPALALPSCQTSQSASASSQARTATDANLFQPLSNLFQPASQAPADAFAPHIRSSSGSSGQCDKWQKSKMKIRANKTQSQPCKTLAWPIIPHSCSGLVSPINGCDHFGAVNNHFPVF